MEILVHDMNFLDETINAIKNNAEIILQAKWSRN